MFVYIYVCIVSHLQTQGIRGGESSATGGLHLANSNIISIIISFLQSIISHRCCFCPSTRACPPLFASPAPCIGHSAHVGHIIILLTIVHCINLILLARLSTDTSWSFRLLLLSKHVLAVTEKRTKCDPRRLTCFSSRCKLSLRFILILAVSFVVFLGYHAQFTD